MYLYQLLRTCGEQMDDMHVSGTGLRLNRAPNDFTDTETGIWSCIQARYSVTIEIQYDRD